MYLVPIVLKALSTHVSTERNKVRNLPRTKLTNCVAYKPYENIYEKRKLRFLENTITYLLCVTGFQILIASNFKFHSQKAVTTRMIEIDTWASICHGCDSRIVCEITID